MEGPGGRGTGKGVGSGGRGNRVELGGKGEIFGMWEMTGPVEAAQSLETD